MPIFKRIKLLDNLKASGQELDRNCNAATRIKNVTGATLAVNEFDHEGRIITLNAAAGVAVTLPASVGGGAKYKFIIGTTITSVGTTIKVANTTDAFQGWSNYVGDDAAALTGFIAVAGTDDTVTLNGTTTGGYVGDTVEFIDVGAGRWQVEIFGKATGGEATPFSATV